MNVRRPLPLLGLLLFAAGCGKSTADWAKQMKSPDPARRLQAIHALQSRAKEKEVVLPVLIEALKDDDTYVRRDAAKALGRFGPGAAEAVPALLPLLADKEPSVRKAAGQSLEKIGPTAAKAAAR